MRLPCKSESRNWVSFRATGGSSALGLMRQINSPSPLCISVRLLTARAERDSLKTMQQIVAARLPYTVFINRSWRNVASSPSSLVPRASTSSLLFRASFSSSSPTSRNSPNRSRGVLPRFHAQTLPSSKGEVVRVQGDEFWHMAKVLRLAPNDRVELFNGAGGIVQGCIQRVDRSVLDVIALEDPQIIAPEGVQWHVYAAFGSLKGGRADWLVEKCTELGASSITPLLTERSPTIPDNRVDRLQRVILAAVKQCQRLHGMTLGPPVRIQDFLPIVSHSELSLLAAAEATPLLNILSSSIIANDGLLIVGPEGDFTEEDVRLMTNAGATPVGLGPYRLRVETATVALLATAMMWSDAQKLDT